MRAHLIGSFAAGVLAANSLPHLATGTTGSRMLTPFDRRKVGPAANLAWGVGNLAAGLGLARLSHRGDGPWERELIAFSAGGGAFLIWGAIGEAVLKINAGR